MEANSRISNDIINQLSYDIHDANGNEVFWCGNVDKKGLVTAIKVVARGNETSVPVLFPHIEKGDVVIHNHPSGYLMPSEADLAIAGELGNRGIGFFIINNDVDKIYVVAEILKPGGNDELDVENSASVLEEGGALSKILPGYEPRTPQIDMVKAVSNAFNNNLISAIEAGTGVGKSFAYLIPAFMWAMANNERIVVSTATINLQQQLMEKDIPLVRKVLKCKESAKLVKGRRNYICLRRLNEALEEDSLFRTESDELSIIKEWADISKDGSLSDLSFKPSSENWTKVCSESDLCSGMRCANFDKCFVMLARKEASAAAVLVVNHHLLFADLSLRNAGMGNDAFAVLPPFQKIIFDEAHNIEESATSFFSQIYNRFSLKKTVNRIFQKKRKNNRGIVIQLEKIVGSSEDSIAVPTIVKSIIKKSENLEATLLNFNDFNSTLSLEGSITKNWEIGIMEPMLDLQQAILSLDGLIRNMIKSIPDERKEDPIVQEAEMQLNRLVSTSSFMESFRSFEEDDESVFWIEKKKLSDGNEFLQFNITPLDISRLMNEAVYAQYSSVLLTSATLSVNNNFNFWANRIGINYVEQQRQIYYSFASPFNYKERALLLIPNDSPDPKDNEEFIPYIANFIKESIIIAEGGALILFTSYYMMNQIHSLIGNDIVNHGLTIFRQGDDDRSRLLNNFKNDAASVLFATDSFWEGVDVPGESLKLVVITKLPFKVPSEPVTKARLDLISKKGGNPFFEMSLPEAVTRLKQGFGRLMRHRNDRGIVSILDSRLITKRYGELFIKSLPETQRVISDFNKSIDSIEGFLYQ